MAAEATPVTDPQLLTSVDDGVLTLTLNRPEVLNAITPALLDEVTDALREAASGRTVRAVIITGAGRGFCSGQDLRATAGEGGLDVGAILRDHYTPAIRAIRSMDQPVIAAVNGVAAGAGFSLALACDLRIAAESATFVQAFVRIGLIPDLASTYFLPRLIGPARAAELTMLGDTVDASRALELGVVNWVVPDAELAVAAADLAGRLAGGSWTRSTLDATVLDEHNLLSFKYSPLNTGERYRAFRQRALRRCRQRSLRARNMTTGGRRP